MAEIRETLTLIDNFSAVIDKFVDGLRSGAQVAGVSMGQIQASAAAAMQQVSAHVLSGRAAVQNYAAGLSQTRQQIAAVAAELQVQQTLLTSSASATGSASSATGRYARAVTSLTRELMELNAREQALNSSLNTAAGSTKKAQSALSAYEKQARSARSASSSLASGLKGLFATFVSIQSVKAVLNLSDQMSQATARLNMMNDGLQTTEQLNEMVRASANEARGSYADMAAMVGKLGTLAGDSFSSSKEIVAFAEQFQKHLALSGADATQSSAAILQMTQALSSGVLRGEELNSILENAPSAAQAIARELGVSVGEMRNLAAEGRLTANVVKNALLSAADDTNAAFNQIPYTWSQVLTKIKDLFIKAFEPLIDAIGKAADWIADNWDNVGPILIGVGTGAGIAAAGFGFLQFMINMATAAQYGFNAALAASGIGLIAILIGVAVGALYKWVQSVGGADVAWMIFQMHVTNGIERIKTNFEQFKLYLDFFWNTVQLGFEIFGITVQSTMASLKETVLLILEGLVNTAIDLINALINGVNNIPGISIPTIEKVTWGTQAHIENMEADYQGQIKTKGAEVLDEINKFLKGYNDLENNYQAGVQERQAEVDAAIAAAQQAEEQYENFDLEEYLKDLYPDGNGALQGVAQDVSDIRDGVVSMDEDLKMLEDVAIRRYEAKINSTQLTPSVTVNVDNSAGNLNERGIANAVARILIKQSASATTATYAEVTG